MKSHIQAPITDDAGKLSVEEEQGKRSFVVPKLLKQGSVKHLTAEGAGDTPSI